MRLLIDEDSQSKIFVQHLRDARHDVVTVAEAGMISCSDVELLAFAVETGRVVYTRNWRDFRALHLSNPGHPGILAEHQSQRHRKNLDVDAIVSALDKIEESGLELAGQFVSVNAWQ